MKLKNEASSNIFKYAAIGGLGVLAFGAATYYYLFKSKRKQQQSQPPAKKNEKVQTSQNTGPKPNSMQKEQIIKLLDELRRELYPLYKLTQAESKVFKEKTGKDTLGEEEMKIIYETCKSFSMIITFIFPSH